MRPSCAMCVDAPGVVSVWRLKCHHHLCLPCSALLQCIEREAGCSVGKVQTLGPAKGQVLTWFDVYPKSLDPKPEKE